MILKYVDTILPLANSEYRLEDKVSEDTRGMIFGTDPVLEKPRNFLELEVIDSDPRAIAYVAGSSPNM